MENRSLLKQLDEEKLVNNKFEHQLVGIEKEKLRVVTEKD